MPVTEEISRGELLAGRYRVGPRIGSGGMATVFLAEDEVLGREVAVKRVHTDGSAADAGRLRREARLGASLAHPNMVMIFDTVTADDGVFIVMEHVDGRPLSELIGDGMASERLLPILEAIASALDYAHRNGVVHRDVKPANVLIADDGQVKLVDLGAAIGSDVTRVTEEHEIVGTLTYLPPERLSGESPGEPAGDIYSLAVLAFEALSGRQPWRGATPSEHLGHVLSGAPEVSRLWPQAPPGVAAALERGMDPDPAARYATAGALVADIEVGLRESLEPTRRFTPVAAEPVATATFPDPPAPPPPVGTAERWPRRIAPIVLGACVVLVAAIALAANGGGGSPPVARDRSGAKSHTSNAGSSDAKPANHSGSSATPSTATAPPADSSTTAGTTATTPASTDPSSLNDQGYALIQQGRYDEAIPLLRRAVSGLSSDTSSLTYAYALFNLGHALRLAGQPQAAIPILEQRLRIPNQTATVQAELDAARAAAGQTQASPPGRALGHSKPAKPPKPEKAPKPENGD
jgi:serine/threonine protein kinase